MPVFIILVLIVIFGTAYSLNRRKQKGSRSTTETQNTRRFLPANDQLSQYIKSGIKEYRVLCTLDEFTCDMCGNMDLKAFPVNKAIIGRNFPPFHDGCRCTTVAVINISSPEGKRAARDPKTKKLFYVSDRMAYPEYRVKFLNK